MFSLCLPYFSLTLHIAHLFMLITTTFSHESAVYLVYASMIFVFHLICFFRMAVASVVFFFGAARAHTLCSEWTIWMECLFTCHCRCCSWLMTHLIQFIVFSFHTGVGVFAEFSALLRYDFRSFNRDYNDVFFTLSFRLSQHAFSFSIEPVSIRAIISLWTLILSSVHRKAYNFPFVPCKCVFTFVLQSSSTRTNIYPFIQLILMDFYKWNWFLPGKFYVMIFIVTSIDGI